MRRASIPLLIGTLGVATGALAACGDDPTVPVRPAIISVARDIGDSTVTHGWAEDINAAGWIVGSGQTTLHADGQYRPFVWSPTGELTVLDRMPGTTGHAMAGAINDRGDVVGYSGKRPYLWTASGGMRDLGLPAGADHAVPMDVSEDGRVVGAWLEAGGRRHPFLWTAEGGMRDLPLPLNVDGAAAHGVNARGQAVGYGCTRPCDATSASWALMWMATGELLDLGRLLGVRQSTAIGITEDGVVAGSLQRRKGGPWVAFTWSTTAGLRELGRLPDATGTMAQAIGEGGHVVGASGRRPFAWTAKDGMRELGGLAGIPSPLDAWASGVNRSGQTVGTIYTHQGPRPVVFVPTPPP